MAYTMTYDSLIEDIQNYIERGTSEDTIVYNQLPRLINLAERRLGRELKTLTFQTTVTTTLTSGVAVLQKPTNWKATVSINVAQSVGSNTRIPVFSRSYEYLRVYWPNDASTSIPEIYADYGPEHWIFAPTPNANLPIEISFYASPEFLSEENQTNLITEQYPQLLLYGTLMETAPFLKDDQRLQVWTTMYGQAMQDIVNDNLVTMKDRSTTRERT
jgi:hypothetical protein